MPTVKNSTDKVVTVRTGRGSYDYRFYHVPANGSIEVTNAEGRLIAKRVRQTKTAGIAISGYLRKPLPKQKKKTEKEEASSEIN